MIQTFFATSAAISLALKLRMRVQEPTVTEKWSAQWRNSVRLPHEEFSRVLITKLIMTRHILSMQVNPWLKWLQVSKRRP